MAEDSEELSEVYEEEEDYGIKKVYETRPLIPISKQLDEKKIEDPDLKEVDFDGSEVDAISEEKSGDEKKGSSAKVRLTLRLE